MLSLMGINIMTEEKDFGSVLNFIMEHHNLSLHVFNSRYGDGIIAFLAYGEERAERIIYCYTAGDSFYEEVYSYFRDAKWYPIVYGTTTIDALDKLLEFVNQSFIQDNIKLWITAVDRASG